MQRQYGYAPEQQKDNRIFWVALVAILLFFQYQNQRWPFDGSFQPDQQRDQQIDDGDSKADDNLLSDSYVVFVYEGLSLTYDQEIVLRGADDFIAARGMAGKRVWDKDQSAAQPVIAAAKAKGISPPFVAIIKDRNIKHIAPYPKSYNELDQLIR